jgi:hypothetical protein
MGFNVAREGEIEDVVPGLDPLLAKLLDVNNPRAGVIRLRPGR